MRVLRIAAIAFPLWAVGNGTPVAACSVPVFRYALDWWQADDYRLLLFHRGPLDDDGEALASRLEAGSAGPSANVRLQRVDLDHDPDPVLVALWKALDGDTLPLLVVQRPPRAGGAVNLWAGRLEPTIVDQLLDSPVRAELARRLLDSDSVVWVFLESGDAERDDAAFALLQAEIARAQRTIELPELLAADPLARNVDPESLNLRFTSLRVSRADPAERFTVAMLLRVEPDLLDPRFVEQPMVFPVFGRGRALYALVGNGITRSTIDGAARYLAGPRANCKRPPTFAKSCPRGRRPTTYSDSTRKPENPPLGQCDTRCSPLTQRSGVSQRANTKSALVRWT